MSTKDDEFLKKLRATFKGEAEEHLQLIASGLLNLEKTPSAESQPVIVDDVFRAAHSLKGAARAVDFFEIESLCQSLEDMFHSWKRPENPPAPAEFDSAQRTLDAVAFAMSIPSPPRDESVAQPSLVNPDFEQAVVHQQVSAPSKIGAPAPVEKRSAFSTGGTVRIAVAKLDARLVEAEEMLTVKQITKQREQDLVELGRSFDAWKNEWAAFEPEARALRQAIDRPTTGRTGHTTGAGLSRLLAFLDRNFDQFKALESDVAALTRAARLDSHVVGKLVGDLLADSKTLLLLPFGTLAASFPKLVRDLCREQGKEADLVILGKEVEIDKRVLEEMKDPIIHLLRNCVDHGVEPPELRVHLGKPARATITLSLSQVSNSNAELVVADDGAGVDVEKVKESAQRQGLISTDNARLLDSAAAQALIFQADVSTSPMITRLSGRGLGLAIVREKAEKLGGTVAVESHLGNGTSFCIELPLTLATFRGILIEAAERLFIVPTFQVERVLRVKTADMQTVEGIATISMNGRAVALVRLDDVLALPRIERGGDPSSSTPVVVLGAGDQRIAFAVDAVLDEQEVLVKPLRKPLSRVRNIAGATVLGSGRIAPILNVADLLKSARMAAGTAESAASRVRPTEARIRSILVAEDSITSRMLIKGILEIAGYKVKTAVDGIEAFTFLRAEKFDLLVSDVEMPRLNGFDLTARIRADRELAELPVVLLTARETQEDRERGMDVGAHAYLVKSSFDQNSLLDAVRRLI